MSDDTAAAVATYREAVAAFDKVTEQVTDASWDAPTPCTEWNVRQLFSHVVAEDLWAPPLLGGRSVDDVAGEIPDDALGRRPDRGVGIGEPHGSCCHGRLRPRRPHDPAHRP